MNVSLVANTNNVQDFTLRGENFLGDVPVTVVAAPKNGNPFTTNIVMHVPADSFTNDTATVSLSLGINQNTRISAYAQYVLHP